MESSSFERSFYTYYFELIKTDGKNVEVKCKLCPATKKPYKMSVNITFNLKKHMEVRHSESELILYHFK